MFTLTTRELGCAFSPATSCDNAKLGVGSLEISPAEAVAAEVTADAVAVDALSLMVEPVTCPGKDRNIPREVVGCFPENRPLPPAISELWKGVILTVAFGQVGVTCPFAPTGVLGLLPDPSLVRLGSIVVLMRLVTLWRSREAPEECKKKPFTTVSKTYWK